MTGSKYSGKSRLMDYFVEKCKRRESKRSGAVRVKHLLNEKEVTLSIREVESCELEAKRGSGVVICFNPFNSSEWNLLTELRKKIQAEYNIPIVFCATKVEGKQKNTVLNHLADNIPKFEEYLRKHSIEVVETSTIEDRNVVVPFNMLIKKMLNARKKKHKFKSKSHMALSVSPEESSLHSLPITQESDSVKNNHPLISPLGKYNPNKSRASSNNCVMKMQDKHRSCSSSEQDLSILPTISDRHIFERHNINIDKLDEKILNALNEERIGKEPPPLPSRPKGKWFNIFNEKI